MKYPNKSQSRGMSLISTMVGILLGAIAVVTIATIYKAMLAQSVQSKIISRQDTESLMALSAIQVLITKAGYGVRDNNGPAGTANVDFVIVSDAALSNQASGTMSGSLLSIGAMASAAAPVATSISGNALVWSWVESSSTGVAQTFCSGLLATNGALSRLQPTRCAGAISSWNTMSWTAQSLVAERVNPTPNTAESFGFRFSVNRSASNCLSFGTQMAGLGAAGLSVAITDDARSSTQSSLNNGIRKVSFTSAFCLPNIARL
jgi:hypothetical protein